MSTASGTPPRAAPPVELLLPPLPGHVRTARLVAVSVARRRGLDPELIEEIRLAVGEACTRSVLRSLHARSQEAVRVQLVETPATLEIQVHDGGEPDPKTSAGVGDLPSHITELTLISASSDEHVLEDDGRCLRLTWYC